MISAFLGDLGSGKTAAMTRLHRFRMRERVKTNFGFLTTYTNMAGLKFPGAVFVESYDGLIRAEGGTILLDEAGIWAAARDWSHLPKEMISMLAQSRKAGLDLLYTAQYFDMSDSLMRNLTANAFKCINLKMLKVFLLHEFNPKQKVSYGWSVHPYDNVTFCLYETLEKIGNPVTGMGRARGRRLAQLGGASGADSATSAALDRLLDRESSRLFERHRYQDSTFSPDELELREWLLSIGLYHPRRTHFAPFWRKQLRRFRWLRLFCLKPKDVPLWACPEYPWAIPPPIDDHLQARVLHQVPMSQLTIPEQDDFVYEFWNPPDLSKETLSNKAIFFSMYAGMTIEELKAALPETSPAETVQEAVEKGLNLDEFVNELAERARRKETYV